MLSEYYLTLKSFHFLAIIAWMVGLLYLPRLFVYHLDFEVGSKAYQTFCRMEWGLLKIIMLPSILFTFFFGVLLAFAMNTWGEPWFHMKLALVLCLAGLHGYFARIAKTFAKGETPALSRKSLRIINEIPFLLAIFIVILAVFKPF
ncbi:MAG TPA: CopD family protein [Alphaproteobacteria bacterium]|nr:CopD family protein [Alphaproteobacteria bacterium]